MRQDKFVFIPALVMLTAAPGFAQHPAPAEVTLDESPAEEIRASDGAGGQQPSESSEDDPAEGEPEAELDEEAESPTDPEQEEEHSSEGTAAVSSERTDGVEAPEQPSGGAPEESPAAIGEPAREAKRKTPMDEGEPASAFGQLVPSLERMQFAEDLDLQVEDDNWHFGIHGHMRFALRCSENCRRQPYLVDDEYFLSGFQYLRPNEREWAEIFLNAQNGNTRAVIGLFASSFSDFGEVNLSNQRGISLGFIQHDWSMMQKRLDMSARAGVFWERDGYLPHYDTYIFGRKRAGGVSVSGRFDDRYYAKGGFAAHAEVPSQIDGFTPVAWGNAGVKFAPVDVGVHVASTWTVPPEGGLDSSEGQGKLNVWGPEARVAIPHVGNLYAGLSFLKADKVAFIAEGFEILHSIGGSALQQNIFGNQSDDGTGAATLLAWDFSWNPALTLARFAGPDAGRSLAGVRLDVFGLAMALKSEQRSDDPIENRDGRVSLKWGTALEYQPSFAPWLFGGLRYDRVILDRDYDPLSFRVLTPRLGVEPLDGVRVFASYSFYSYGDAIRLRPSQIPTDPTREVPDEQAFKLQMEASF